MEERHNGNGSAFVELAIHRYRNNQTACSEFFNVPETVFKFTTIFPFPVRPRTNKITLQFYINCAGPWRTISSWNLICFQFARRTHGK